MGGGVEFPNLDPDRDYTAAFEEGDALSVVGMPGEALLESLFEMQARLGFLQATADAHHAALCILRAASGGCKCPNRLHSLKEGAIRGLHCCRATEWWLRRSRTAFVQTSQETLQVPLTESGGAMRTKRRHRRGFAVGPPKGGGVEAGSTALVQRS